MNRTEAEQIAKIWRSYQNNWNGFAHDILRVRLDSEQQTILDAIQENPRVSVSSGHARGKDYIGAVASLCFLYLLYPSKVISTAPTGRQVVSIMMSETAKIHKNASIPLPGKVLSEKILIPNEPDWFLQGFKAGDKSTESWTGYHSPNVMVVATEASGLAQETFDAIEGILTGHSRLLIIFNPNRTTGEAYKSAKSHRYKFFKLSCLTAKNVIEKKIIIPGQVDYPWVRDKIDMWCEEISKEQFGQDVYDFKFEGKHYRPGDLFAIKVLGEFPREAEGQLIPLAWVERSIALWKKSERPQADCKWGVDVSGMGRDKTVYLPRYGNYVDKAQSDLKSDHMAIAGNVVNLLRHGGDAYIDSIGEGAGVQSRLKELGVKSNGIKFSKSGKGLKDYTGQRTFANLRAYCWWAIRDALDPKNDFNLALPDDPFLVEDLTEPQWEYRSNGDILIEDKEEIKKRLGRSPDYGDALALTFAPDRRLKYDGARY